MKHCTTRANLQQLTRRGMAKEAVGGVTLLAVDLPNLGVRYASNGRLGYEGMAYDTTKDLMDQGFHYTETLITEDGLWDRKNERLQASSDMGGFVSDVAGVATGLGALKKRAPRSCKKVSKLWRKEL